MVQQLEGCTPGRLELVYNKRREVEIVAMSILVTHYALARVFFISREMGQEEMDGVITGCRKRAMFGTGLANSHPGCTNGLRKLYFHLVVGSFLTGMAVWVLNGYLLAENSHAY